MTPSPGSSRSLFDRLRYQSHSGRMIRRHRALHHLRFRRASILHPAVLLLAGYTALALGYRAVIGFWSSQFAFWLPRLGLPDALGSTQVDIAGLATVALPSPRIVGRLPDVDALRMGVAVAAVAMLLAFLTMRGRLLPVAYMVWGAALVHFVATVALWLAPGTFAHDIAAHVTDGLAFVLALLACLPLLLSVSFYLFEYSVAYKLGGTLLIATALIVIAPYQYLAHTVLLAHGTLLPMPLLYVFFGLVFDIAVFIALYGWLMSREV